MGENSLKIGGYNISGMMLAVAFPVLSALGGGAWYAFDALSRFNDLEASVQDAIGLVGRVQATEQTLAANGVDQLGPRLSSIATQMETILTQQAQLLDLRSKVERSSTITDGLGGELDTLTAEIDNLWAAYDAFYAEFKENPIR